MTRVLMVLTGARVWTLNDGTEHPTGFWAEEFLVPYGIFKDKGYDITVSTPGGVTPVVDELSLGISGGLPTTTKKLRGELEVLAPVLESATDVHSENFDDYDLVFLPGGHGPMEDLAYDKVVGEKLNERLESGKLLALLCHSPAAVLGGVSDHTTPFTQRSMTGLSNAEELLNPFAHKAKWLLEDRLKEIGVNYSKAVLPLRPHVVEDRNLITGQNPQSSKKLAETLVEKLEGASS